MTSKPTDKSTSSPGSGGSHLDCGSPDGPTTDLFSQAGSPASRGATPGSALAQKMTVISGRKWLGSFKACGLDGCLARMFRGLLGSRWASTECFLTWKVSATPAGRQVFRLVPSMPRTDASASGLWQTASVEDASRQGSAKGWEEWEKDGRTTQCRLRNEVQAKALWPTARTCSATAANVTPEAVEKLDERYPNLETEGAKAMWPTPRAVQPTSVNQSPTGGPPQSLAVTANEQAAKMWPTATVGDAANAANKTAGRSNPDSAHHDGETLVDATRLWGTPGAGKENTLETLTPAMAERNRGNLEEHVAATLWPTPQEHDKAKDDPKRVGRFGTEHGDLNYEARIWPTPNTRDTRRGCNQKQLATEVDKAMWATPASRDYRYPNAKTYEERGGGKKGEQLPNQAAQMWATPHYGTPNSYRGKGQDPEKRKAGGHQVGIQDQVSQVSGQTTPSSEGGGALNPEFVSWLMGYPPEWLNCAPSAMPSSRKSSRK